LSAIPFNNLSSLKLAALILKAPRSASEKSFFSIEMESTPTKIRLFEKHFEKKKKVSNSVKISDFLGVLNTLSFAFGTKFSSFEFKERVTSGGRGSEIYEIQL